MEHISSRYEDGLTGVKMSLQGDSLFEGGIVGNLGRTNSPTSCRHGDGFGFIRIWVTPPNRLAFWDGAPSSYTIPVIFSITEFLNHLFTFQGLSTLPSTEFLKHSCDILIVLSTSSWLFGTG